LLLLNIILFLIENIRKILLNNLTFLVKNNKINDDINNISFVFKNKSKNKFELNNKFLEWLVGFTDAEGNFSITLRDNPNIKVDTLSKKKKN